MSVPIAVRPGGLDIPCRGVLFDCDGVLVDSTASGETAWTEWARRYDLDPAQVLRGVHGRRSADTVRRFVPSARFACALQAIEAIEIGTAATTAGIAGAAQLLAGLPPNWAVVTSASPALATTRLDAAGLPPPPVLISAADVAVGKPAPNGYLEAARRLGLPISDCVVFEDSANGVQAGHAAGAVRVIGVGERALATEAEIVVRDLTGIRWEHDSLVILAGSMLRPPES
ncbi:MAG TPA: HAD-IA family hydrolase [Trebonia sp.]|jgi:sugar-phosphatase